MDTQGKNDRHKFWSGVILLSGIIAVCMHAWWLPLLAYPLARSDAKPQLNGSSVELPNYLLFSRSSRHALPTYEFACEFVAGDRGRRILIFADQQPRSEAMGAYPAFVETTLKRFRDRGVADENLAVIGDGTALTTTEILSATKQWLGENPDASLLFPTHRFAGGLHNDIASRILTPLERKRVRILGFACRGVDETTWWKNAVGLKSYISDYLMLTHFWAFGEPRPDINWDPDEYGRMLAMTRQAHGAADEPQEAADLPHVGP